MKKVIGAALLAIALVGCGGPLEGDDTQAAGSTQQGLGNIDGIPNPNDGPKLNAVVNNPIDLVARVPAFQDQMHVTDPLHANCHPH